MTSRWQGDQISAMIYYRIALVFTALFAIYVAYIGYGAYQSWAAKSEIFEAPADFVIGPADAPLTIVKFMDYACEHCREAHAPIMEALKADGKTRLIIRPLPSQSADGSRAARLAYGTARLGKFPAAHEFMISHFGTVDDAFLSSTAAAIGVSTEELEAAVADDSSRAAVWNNFSLFNALGGRVTPTFFIGPDTIYIPYDETPTAEKFKTLFTAAHKGQ